MKKLLKEVIRVLNNEELTNVQYGMLLTVQEELIIKLKHESNYQVNRKKAQKMSEKIKNVQLGCGNHILANYINIDINDKADIYWDIRKSLPFNDNSIENIFSEHFFEHLDYPVSANRVLEESYRVLKNGGEIIIGVPDCDFPLNDIYNQNVKNITTAKEKWYSKRKDVLENMNTSLDYLNYVMRDQLYHSEYHPHYWGYNRENLTLMLKKHGFKKIKKWSIDRNIINPKREWGTLYLIAQK